MSPCPGGRAASPLISVPTWPLLLPPHPGGSHSFCLPSPVLLCLGWECPHGSTCSLERSNCALLKGPLLLLFFPLLLILNLIPFVPFYSLSPAIAWL